MRPWEELSKDKVLEKLSNYKRDKRLQGFLRFKVRNKLKKLKTATRQLKIGVNPTGDMRQILKVSNLIIPSHYIIQILTRYMVLA